MAIEIDTPRQMAVEIDRMISEGGPVVNNSRFPERVKTPRSILEITQIAEPALGQPSLDKVDLLSIMHMEGRE